MGFFLSLCANGKGFYGTVEGTWLGVIVAHHANWLGQLPAPLFQELPQGLSSITAPLHGDAWRMHPASRQTNQVCRISPKSPKTPLPMLGKRPNMSLLCPNDLSYNVSPYKIAVHSMSDQAMALCEVSSIAALKFSAILDFFFFFERHALQTSPVFYLIRTKAVQMKFSGEWIPVISVSVYQ